jgi:hypothetical protein
MAMPNHPDRRTIVSGLAALPAFSILGSPPAHADSPRPMNARVVMSGHSLTDPIEQPLLQLARAAGGKETLGLAIDRSTVPGSTMEYRWQPEIDLPIDARRDIASYDVLVVTERVPVRSAMAYHDTLDYALKWTEHAWAKGNGGRGAETILYASWVDLKSGPGNDDPYDSDEKIIPFRERLDLEMGSWQEIADHVNRKRSGGVPPMRVISGPKIMAAVHDAIAAGSAPGFADISELFEDSIHVNAKGGVLMALAHFAVIYRRDPREIPALRGEPGWPSKDQAKWMKNLVWDVLRSYPDSGLG